MVINKYSYDLVRTEVKTFGESLSLSNDNVNASNVDIYSNDKHVFIVWQQSNSTHSSVALRVSDDLGKSFGSEKIFQIIAAIPIQKCLQMRIMCIFPGM